MGAFTFEQNTNSGPFKMYRGEVDAAKQPIYEERSYSDYIVPPKGQYRLKLTGFAEPVEVAISDQYRKPDGPTHRKETKLELEIVSERGKGKRWVCSYVTFSLGDRANLFRIYLAGVLKGNLKEAPAQRVYDDMIGVEFEAYVNVSDKRDDKGNPIRASLAWDTIAPISDGADEYDPFADDTAA